MPIRPRRKATALLVFLALVPLLVAACSSSGGTPTGDTRSGFMSVKQYDAALKQDYAKFSWPAHRQPDLDSLFRQTQPPSDSHGGSPLLQAGYQDLILGLTNQCAWYLAWNDAHSAGDKADEKAALKVMTDVIPNLPTLDPAGKQFAISAAQKAALGDGTTAMQVVQGNCSDTKWKST